MKKFVFGIIAFVVVLIVVSTLWHQNVQKENGVGQYQKEMAKREERIRELEDSIRNLQETLDFYREAVIWFRTLDDKELDKNIKFLRSVPPNMIP